MSFELRLHPYLMIFYDNLREKEKKTDRKSGPSTILTIIKGNLQVFIGYTENYCNSCGWEFFFAVH